MQTKAKSNSVVTHSLSEGGALVFTVKDAGTLVFDFRKASAQCREQAERHGWIQRISDAAALSRDTATGKPAAASEKLAAMRKLVEHYETGTAAWRMAQSAGGVGALDKGLLVRALREIYPERTEEQLQAWVEKRTAQERAALMASEKIKPLVERYRAEQGAGVDADGLLGELSESQSDSAEQQPLA